MPKCKVCGTRLAEETTKCPSCGAAAGSTVAGTVSPGANLQKSVCPACNKQILGEHKYCPDCGTDLQAAAKQTAALKPAQNTASDVSLVSGQKETDIDAFEYEIQYILTKLKNTSLTEVVIPRVFSEIRGYYDEEEGWCSAFDDCENLRSVIIPDSVKVIGDSAFKGCQNLQSVTIPDSVEAIGTYAFARCKNLHNVTIPDSVKEIGDDAFFNCEGLQSVTIPDSVEVIGDHAFGCCENLRSVTILNSVKVIRERAFAGCKSLQTVTIPDSVEVIGYAAFAGCKSLQHITIPHSVEVIGENAFWRCENLRSVTIRNPQFSKSDINRIFKGASNLYEVEVGNKIIKTSLVTRIDSEDVTDILKAIFIGP